MAATVRVLDLTGPFGRLHVQRYGSTSAPLVLALPGLSGDSEDLSYLGERLGGEARQLVVLDWRGRGRSERTAPGTYGWHNHALDALAVADELGFETFAVVGRSMGGSVAMRLAELAPQRLREVALVDVAGRVDPGVGPVIADAISRLPPTTIDAVAEDRAYTATQDPYERWRHLTMPTLLLRATRELRPGSGFVVPVGDRDAFVRAVPTATLVEVDANHLTITTHPATVAALRRFLT